MVNPFNPLIKVYETSQMAWEEINEYIFLNEMELKAKGEGRDGNASMSYDNIFLIKKPWVKPNFDFFRMFGYHIQKWSHLVNNYVNKDKLKSVKIDIDYREKRKQRVYNVTLHFDNKHDNGKDCLISLTFSKRLGQELPYLIFHTRACEVTKRLLLDLLLIQRIGEYIYGKYKFQILVYCPTAYLNCEAFTMYHNHRDLFDLWDMSQQKIQPFQKRVLDILKKFLSCKPMDIGYKSHRRAVRQLQWVTNEGKPLPKDKHLYAKHLKLGL